MLRCWLLGMALCIVWIGACRSEQGARDESSVAGAPVAPGGDGGAGGSGFGGPGGFSALAGEGGNQGGGAAPEDAGGAWGGDAVGAAGSTLSAGAADSGAGGGPSNAEVLSCNDGGPGQGATCSSYCAAWFPLCKEHAATAAVFEDETDCLAQCARFTEEQLCCRGYHVTNVPNNPNTHCAHSAGIRTCP